MHSKHLLKYIVILALLLFAISAIPAAAQEGGEQTGGEQTGGEQTGGEQTGGEQTGGEQTGGEQTGGEQTGGEQTGGEETGGEQTGGEQTGGEQTGGEQTGGEQTGGEQVEASPTVTETVETPTETATVVATETATATETVETPTETATVVATETATATETVETPTETATVVATETPTATVEVTPTETVTATATVEASPTVTATETVTTTATVTATLAAADDVESAGSLPGNSTSQIIAIANLNTAGSSVEIANLILDQIGGNGTDNKSKGVYPNGVNFFRDSDLTGVGEFTGILQTGFPAAAAVLTINATAKTADAYPGLSTTATATELFGILIFNKHSNFESVLYCQNAGSSNATISAELYKAGQSTPIVPASALTSSSLIPGQGFKWDIADLQAVQSRWAGGNGQFGYARFTSANPIACVIDNQRVASPYVQSQFQAVPSSGYSGTNLRFPLIFHGHGGSSGGKGTKWNTGISILNRNGSTANVTIKYTAANGYTKSCTGAIGANQTVSWFAPEAGTPASIFNCGGPLSWSYPGPTYGGVELSSNVAVLALANSNRYDTGQALGAGYTSVAASPSIATTKVVCPLAFNKNKNSDWITGITALNVGNGPTNVTFKVVKSNALPSSNTQSFNGGSVGAGKTATLALFEQPSAFQNFEGAVFISSNGQPITAVSSSTNYNTLGAAALYDCLNYP